MWPKLELRRRVTVPVHVQMKDDHGAGAVENICPSLGCCAAKGLLRKSMSPLLHRLQSYGVTGYQWPKT